MDEIKAIIETIVPTEIQQNENVTAQSYILNPYMMDDALNGDGKPQEITTSYQLDVFFKGKGELLTKASQLVNALGAYALGTFAFNWESSARLWRGTLTFSKVN